MSEILKAGDLLRYWLPSFDGRYYIVLEKPACETGVCHTCLTKYYYITFFDLQCSDLLQIVFCDDFKCETQRNWSLVSDGV